MTNERDMSGLSKFHKLILLIYISVQLNPYATSAMGGIFQWALIATIGILFFIRSVQGKLVINRYIIWLTMFIFLLVSSLLWTKNIEYTFGYIKNGVLIIITLGYISNLVKTKKELFEIISIFVYAAAINALFIILLIDFSSLGLSRLRIIFDGYEWNANRIGTLMALATYANIVIRNQNTIKINKNFNSFLALVFSVIALISGSRQAFFVLVFSPLMYLYLLNKRKRIKYILIGSISMYFLFFIVMNNQALFNMIGMRIQSLLSIFLSVESKSQAVQYSDEVRLLMMRFGLKEFMNNPIIGHGMGSYKVLYGLNFGREMYAHNNYIELLVGLGMTGFIVYYYILVNIVKQSLRYIKKGSCLVLFSLITTFTLLVLDIGSIGVSSYYSQLFICLAYLSIHVYKKEKTTHQSKSVER
ncbi:O-antigen ligase family protein [Clostridiisalibacter paucivorans]|uniref:O-antigen ligase family protein n=1 Tax=Clostridiisalibacter paucivorans TaxID=408753 RepID=UPI000478E33B|nr:O-antigen ligase family protein [Clostridiisalibacter paucivorans]